MRILVSSVRYERMNLRKLLHYEDPVKDLICSFGSEAVTEVVAYSREMGRFFL